MHGKKYDKNYQMMIVWYVDNLKVSHVDSFEIIKFYGYLSIIYGGPTVHKGKVHNYLGMYLDQSKQGIVKASMIKYLQSVLKYTPEH